MSAYRARLAGRLRTRLADSLHARLADPLRRQLTDPPRFRALAVPAALGLLAVAVVHLIDGPGSLSDQFYVGALELALAAACVPLSAMLLTRPVGALWHAAGALCSAALLIFIASRTIGLPGSTDDIDNWGQSLGVLNMVFEAAIIALAAVAVRHRSAAPAAGTAAGPAIDPALL